MSQLETNTTGLQALLDMVNALPNAGSGGNENNGLTLLGSGEFAGNSKTTYEFTHGLGKIPKVFLVYEKSTSLVTYKALFVLLILNKDGTAQRLLYYSSGSSTSRFYNMSILNDVVCDEETIILTSNGSAKYSSSGYYWYAYG